MNVPSLIHLLVFAFFCSIVLIQVFYHLYFFSRLAMYQAPVKKQSQEHPVSVIICGRDEAHNLVRNLPGVLVQSYKTSHEVIVVNDNSVDESKYLLDEFKKSFKNLHPVYLTQEAMMIPGKKFPLSMGIKSARYEVVLLTDADCVPASEFWLHKMQDAYQEHTEIVLGYGAYHKLPGLLNKLIRFETFHAALQYLSFALAGMPYMGVGRNLSYKKNLFFKNKGFSSINQIPGGDDDLFINKVANARNTAISIDPDSYTLSTPKKTWAEWWKQKYRHYSAARFYKAKHKFLLGFYSFSHVLVYPLFVLSAVFFNWQYALAVLGLRLLLQAVIWYKAMHKLQEGDLWPLFLFFDLWMCFYYLLFVPALWKKPRKSWN